MRVSSSLALIGLFLFASTVSGHFTRVKRSHSAVLHQRSGAHVPYPSHQKRDSQSPSSGYEPAFNNDSDSSLLPVKKHKGKKNKKCSKKRKSTSSSGHERDGSNAESTGTGSLSFYGSTRPDPVTAPAPGSGLTNGSGKGPATVSGGGNSSSPPNQGDSIGDKNNHSNVGGENSGSMNNRGTGGADGDEYGAGSGSGSGATGDDGTVVRPGSKSGNVVHAKGLLGSTMLASGGSINYNFFDPSLVYHGPGTTFGSDGAWQGGACMYDDLPHADMPSVAMDQSFWQDGLACGACVEIASTSADKFSNDVQWKVEQPQAGELPSGKTTVAFVSDQCPGVNQCWSGLDMHPDAWNSVTNNANGSKLPINWRFVSCKSLFQKTGSGGKSLQVHWRTGASAGFCQVQIRGSWEPVVRVEARVGSGDWITGKHIDNSFWQFSSSKGDIKDESIFAFRITDWQGQTITTEVGAGINTDIMIDANFESIKSHSQFGGGSSGDYSGGSGSGSNSNSH